MTKISNKKLIVTIITCAIIVAGMLVGTLCHFLSGGFFNYGVEYSSAKTVDVSFYVTDMDLEDAEDFCEDAFSAQGIKYSYENASELQGTISYTFSYNTDSDKISQAVEAIQTSLSGFSGAEGINIATFSVNDAFNTNIKMYKLAAIAVAVAIAVQAVYTVIRFRLNLAVLSLITNIHFVGIAVSLLALLRIPLGIYSVCIVFATLIVGMIVNQLYYTNVKANLKDENMQDTSFVEKADDAYAKTIKYSTLLCGALLVICAILAVVMAIAAQSVQFAYIAVAALLGCVCAWYSSAIFSPSIYSLMEKIAITAFKPRRPGKDKPEKASGKAIKDKESN